MLEISNISNLYEIIHNIDYRVIYETTKEIDYKTVLSTFAGVHIALVAFVYPYIYSSNKTMKLKTPGLYEKQNKNFIFKNYFEIEIIFLIISLIILLFSNSFLGSFISFTLVFIASWFSKKTFDLLKMYNINYEDIEPEYEYPFAEMKLYEDAIDKKKNVEKRTGIHLNDKSIMKSDSVVNNNKEMQLWQQVVIDKIHNSADITDTVNIIELKIVYYLDSYLKDISKRNIKMDDILGTRNIFAFVDYVMDRVHYISQVAVDNNLEEVAELSYDSVLCKVLIDDDKKINDKTYYFKYLVMDYFASFLCYKIINRKFDFERDLNIVTGVTNTYIKNVKLDQPKGRYSEYFKFIQLVFRYLVRYNPELFKYKSELLVRFEENMKNIHFHLMIKYNKNVESKKKDKTLEFEDKKFYIPKIYFDIMEVLYDDRKYSELLDFIFTIFDKFHSRCDGYMPNTYKVMDKVLEKYSFYGAISKEKRQVILLLIFITYTFCPTKEDKKEYLTGMKKAKYFKEYKDLMKGILLIFENKKLIKLLNDNWNISTKDKNEFIKELNTPIK